jgi:hypothetical protein
LIEGDPESPDNTLSVVLDAELLYLVDLVAYRHNSLLNECDLTEFIKLVDDHKPLLVKHWL